MRADSRILQWFSKPATTPSAFEGSFFLGWVSKGLDRWIPVRRISWNTTLNLARVGMLLLVFSTVFIPRFPLGGGGEFYRVDLRIEDLLLAATSLLTFAVLSRRPLAEVPAVEKAFVIFLLAVGASVLNGLFFRTIDKPVLSLLYLVKWVEYFLVFVVTARLATQLQGSDLFLKGFFLLGLAVAAYGWWEHFYPAAKAVYPNYYRLFERPPFHGDANHIGGFLAVWIGFFTGIFLKAQRRSQIAMFFGAICFVFFPFIWTYSRKSYFALAGALSLAFLCKGSRRRTLFLISSLVLLALALPTRLAERLIDLGEAFSSSDPFHSSWATNWVMWQSALWNFDQFFLLGSGWGSRHRLFYESQYIQILSETGLLGMSAFLFLCASLAREVTSALAARLSGREQAVAWGWLLGFVGLLIHSGSCVSWTVSKVAIPFWFLSAVVFVTLKGRFESR